MNTKLLTGMGCLLLLAATMAPAVLGHDDVKYETGTGDDYDVPGNGLTTNPDGVSGRYVGAAGVSVLNNGDPIPIGENFTIDSGVLTSGGLMYCDFEVLSPGTTPLAIDELHVDGAPAGTYANAHTGQGPLPGPDSVDAFTGWDDGGYGGACHTNDTYEYTPYNTPGCPEALAYANDDTFGPLVFIGASCDWESQGATEDQGIIICLLNAISHANEDEINACLAQLAETISCTANMSCPGGDDDACGGDGSSDGTNYGWGGDGVPYPSGVAGATWTPGYHFGETYDRYSSATNDTDDDGDNCGPEHASAAVFVLHTVVVNATGTSVGDLNLVYAGGTVATKGDIWQEDTLNNQLSSLSSTDSGPVPPLPQCNHASSAVTDSANFQTVCQDDAAHGNVICAPFLSIWVAPGDPAGHEVVTCNPWYAEG